MATPFGDRAGRRRQHHRTAGRGLPLRGRRRGRVAGRTHGGTRVTQLAALDIPPRLGRLRVRLAPAELDALLVTKLANIRYLTGFTGSAAMLLVAADHALFVTDGRYTEQSKEQLGAAGVDTAVRIE